MSENENYLITRDGILSKKGVYFLLEQLNRKKELSPEIYLELLKIFLPQSLVKTKRDLWEIDGNGKLNMINLVNTNILNLLLDGENYLKENHWFQTFAGKLRNEIPKFSPKEIDDMAEFHFENCKFLFIIPKTQRNNLAKFSYCYNNYLKKHNGGSKFLVTT